jgi:hypothetical protein
VFSLSLLKLGEPLIFIEVALLKDTAASIQEVLWDDPPTPESEARCALFYSISSTQVKKFLRILAANKVMWQVI